MFDLPVDSAAIDANQQIPEETLQQLKKFGLFGQRIPREYGLCPFYVVKMTTGLYLLIVQ